jgi:PAS domain S-box-containing protein
VRDEGMEPWAAEPEIGLLRAIIEAIPDAIYVKDLQGRYRLINAVGAQRVGRPVETILGQTDHDLYDHDAAAVIQAIDRTILATGVASTHEDRTSSKGATRVYLTTKSPYRDAAGQVIGVIGISRDITEREQAEAAQQSSEERFRLALEGSPVILYRQDTELRHTWVYNPQHGFTPEAVLGKTDAELVRPEDAAIQAAMKRRVLETGVGVRAVVCLTVGVETAYYDMTIEPLRGPPGEIIGITGAATDVTVLKRAEQALARREAQLAEAQQLAHLGSWEWDVATNRFNWSDEHYRIFGVDPQVGPLTRALVEAPIHPDDVGRVRALFESSLRTGEPFETEFRVVRPDGEVRIIHSRGAVLRDAAGQPERIIGTAQDITERTHVEAELHDSQQAAARLEGIQLAAREMAHLLNNALAMPVAAIDLLQQQAKVPPHLRRMVDKAATSLQDAKLCIQHFQQVVRVETKDTVVGPTLDLARSVQPDGPQTDAGGAGRAASGARRP